MWCVCVCEDCVYEGNVQRCVGVWEFKKRKVHRKKGKKEKRKKAECSGKYTVYVSLNCELVGKRKREDRNFKP